ncbi:hypothetical protein L9F63_014068, partial [Diploptera punctata]
PRHHPWFNSDIMSLSWGLLYVPIYIKSLFKYIINIQYGTGSLASMGLPSPFQLPLVEE